MNLEKKIPDKIVSTAALTRILQQAKAAGNSIVFTNGCFDLLHPGHIRVLAAASGEGDVLVVGLNSDTSVQKLKGKNRPVMDQQARAIVLAALSMVDYVVIFEEETPLELIRQLAPDVLVKGGDYREDEIVGAQFVSDRGGRTVTVPLLEGFSSTSLIGKTKK
ncbi:MAG: D-glycero-beta-D-manno-heptose 1-phosphate adenylyltransferase [Bacteroidales bacterium]|nr:D-glycero-beta-D-manno-heptose 1-phosphate adenylyltransferase [Bacteroidales bacterium]MDT8430657.1 D-glycero-beta-D-manno-heptose 1-phosphate adenylyltransferase [Bacteroidales bacterium]